MTKRARGLNYDEETNMSIYLSEFNEFANHLLDDPLTFNEAISRRDKDSWLTAMNDEIKSLQDHNTWEYAYPPSGANIIGTKFVYKIK